MIKYVQVYNLTIVNNKGFITHLLILPAAVGTLLADALRGAVLVFHALFAGAADPVQARV
jgi:hypothetical protein